MSQMPEAPTMTEEKPVTAKKTHTIIKAVHKLKIKTGPGGFDPRNVTQARRRLSEATHLFPAVSAHDLALLEDALQAAKAGGNYKEVTEKILSACTEIKAHGVMFQYPLVAEIAESLMLFCTRLKSYPTVAHEVITEYLKALRIAIGEGPRAITPRDHETLLEDLTKATSKVLREQSF